MRCLVHGTDTIIRAEFNERDADGSHFARSRALSDGAPSLRRAEIGPGARSAGIIDALSIVPLHAGRWSRNPWSTKKKSRQTVKIHFYRVPWASIRPLSGVYLVGLVCNVCNLTLSWERPIAATKRRAHGPLLSQGVSTLTASRKRPRDVWGISWIELV